MRPLVVGQAPSADTDGRPPFCGRSGARLAELLGVEHRQLGQLVDLVNLLERWPGKSPTGRGDAFPYDQAAAAAAMLLAVTPHDRVIVCGRGVWRALGLHGDVEPLGRGYAAGRLFLNLPHPSGLCRWWNDPANVDRAGAVLRHFVAANLRAVG